MIFVAAAIVAIFGYALYGLTAGGVHLPADAAALVVIGTIIGALCAALVGSIVSGAHPGTPVVPPLEPPSPGPGPRPDPGPGPGPGPVPKPDPRKPRNTGITATSFRDTVGDHDNAINPDADRAVAVPNKFPVAGRPLVRCFYPAGVWPPEHTVDCTIPDVGPWYDGRPGWPYDPYWPGNRPRAESDPRTNGAGIDLTPAAWAALGFTGNLDLIKEKIDWDFVDYLDGGTVPGPGPSPPGPTPALGGIVDTNEDTTNHLSALKVEHVGTVFRYAARSQAASHNKVLITPSEARAIAAAGMNLGLVFETDGHPSGATTGDADGRAALATASQVGAPRGACIYYAVDYDAPQADMPGIVAAFTAFKAVVSPTYAVGCYGSGSVNSQLLAAGLIKYRWITQSSSFAGSKAAVAAGQYELLQHLPQTVGGLDCDPNTPREPNLDIGVFVPFGTLPEAPTIPPAPIIDAKPDGAPPWLQTMQQITGTREVPGTGNNPVILAWAAAIAKKYPEMASYCARYNSDDIAWCGLTVAYCMAMAGIRPQFGPTDTDKFLWADSWRQFGVPVTNPQPGDVLVFQWSSGGHHVTLYDHETAGDQYACRGGNQSDTVNVTMFPMSACTAIRRPA